MRVLVTGSSGTIGTRLCERLQAEGHDLIAVDWFGNRWSPSLDAITHEVDLRDTAAVERFGSGLSNVDAIIHLAANARVHDLVVDPRLARDNFLTTFNALELARQLKVRRFIFPSSREAYGSGHANQYSEDMVRVERLESAYAASKVGGEALVHSYAHCYGVESVIFRFSNVYGMYDEADRIVPLFIRRAMLGLPLVLYGANKCLDFTYIDDNVEGIMRGLDRFDVARGETFNLGLGEGTPLLEVAQRVKALLGSSSEIRVEPLRVGEAVHYIADIAKARRVLGYVPETSFAEGIKKSVAWYVQEAESKPRESERRLVVGANPRLAVND